MPFVELEHETDSQTLSSVDVKSVCRFTSTPIYLHVGICVQSQTDAILGWVDKNGRAFVMDTWIGGYTSPLLDASQDIYNISGRIQDGVCTLSFTRKRLSSDSKVIHSEL